MSDCYNVHVWLLISIFIIYVSVSGVKDYTSWPTIPQVFIGGEFVGGCDVMLEMHQNGDLIEELQKVGIRSALLDKVESGDKKDWHIQIF